MTEHMAAEQDDDAPDELAALRAYRLRIARQYRDLGLDADVLAETLEIPLSEALALMAA